MKDDMQYINVEGSGGMVRDKETGAILNTNKSEIERARKRKIISKKKEEEFAIRMKDYVLADRLGDIIGIYHSHTKGDNGFSQADITISDQLELTNYLYEMETDKFYTYNPVEENGKVD